MTRTLSTEDIMVGRQDSVMWLITTSVKVNRCISFIESTRRVPVQWAAAVERDEIPYP